MQYKQIQKIIIDKRKLDNLIRIGCPDEQLLQIIKTGKFKKTGDKLIDDTLECLIDFRSFKNWGGNHNPNGINGCNIKKKRGQVDHQVDRQDGGQVVDKDKDKDISNNTINFNYSNNTNTCQSNNINNSNNTNMDSKNQNENQIENKFDEFWKLYTPVKASDGRFVAKGSKQKCFEKYKKLINKGVEHGKIINGLERYLAYCRINGHCSCGAEVFINQRRFENDYSDSECVSSSKNDNGRRPVSISKIALELERESKIDEKDSIPF